MGIVDLVRTRPNASLVFAMLILLGLASTHISTAVGKSSIDIAITDDQVFIAHPTSGRVLSGPLPQIGRISLSSLTPLKGLSGLRAPVALDVKGSQLVVIDAAGPALISASLTTGEQRVVLTGAPLREPSGVTIAANGTIVVTDPAARAIFLIHPTKELQIDRRFEVPTEVHFDPEDGLWVYDASRGLLRLEYVDIETFRARASAGKTDHLSAAPLFGLTRALSFAPRRGLLYVADEGGLRVGVPSSRLALSASPLGRRRLSRLAVNQRFIAGVDEDGSSLYVFERPLPVSVTLDAGVSDSNGPMLDLLSYLANHRLILPRVVTLERPDEPYQSVLVRYKMLNAIRTPIPGDNDSRIRNLFCILNPTRCSAGAPIVDRDNPPREVVIPQLNVDTQLTTSRVDLNGKSARTYVDERVLDPEQRQLVTTQYLARLNPAAEDTLDAELLRRGLILATPMTDQLSPGSVIQLTADGTEQKTGDLSTRCNVSPERSETPTYLPEITRTSTLRALPNAVRVTEGPRLQTEVQLGFEKVVREALPVLPVPGCKPATDLKSAEYVVTEAIRVGQIRYRLPPLAGQGGRGAGVSSQSAKQSTFDERGWRVVPGPFYVGYKAVELARVNTDFGERTINPTAIKPPPEAESLWSRTTGNLTLPSTRWRFDTLVLASDYSAEGSPLDKIRHQYPGLSLSSHERLRTSARSTWHSTMTGQDIKARLEDARKKLAKTITYFDDLAAGTEDAHIGIGEAREDVNRDHPGFISGGRSAWFEATSEGLARRRVASGTPAIGQPEVHKLAKDEHGTHVAGIIAARANSLMPGLAPVANLFLVDTSRALEDTIQEAFDADIRIFNFSFALDASQNDAHTLAELHDRMINQWSSALFVVAAGNEGVDLNARGASPLISWVLEAPNIIGVGAATADASMILPDQPDPEDPTGPQIKGSNFGSKFVQMIAPGDQVYSLGNDQYAFASGTSQAVPQVSAAAAMLWARGLREALKIKARLIATSDWQNQYRHRVWGGLLNVDRAVRHMERNILRTQTPMSPTWAITLDVGATVTARNVRTLEPTGGETFTATKTLPVRKILRLNHLGASQYRIVTLEGADRLTIMFGRLDGRIACADTKILDTTSGLFRLPTAAEANPCVGGGIPVQNVHDYVAMAATIPSSVKF